MNTQMTNAQLATAIAAADPSFTYNKKKHPKAELVALFEKVQKAAEGSARMKHRDADFRSTWPAEGTIRAKVLSLMLSDTGANVQDVERIAEGRWKIGTCRSFWGTDIRGGLDTKTGKWNGCNFTVKVVGKQYFAIVPEEAGERPSYI